MKSAKVFTAFIFLLVFVVCVSAQEKVDPKITKEIIDSLDKGAEFNDLIGLGPKKLKT